MEESVETVAGWEGIAGCEGEERNSRGHEDRTSSRQETARGIGGRQGWRKRSENVDGKDWGVACGGHQDGRGSSRAEVFCRQGCIMLNDRAEEAAYIDGEDAFIVPWAG
eukprot:scaffold21086_cov23-Tisochrysis_lutea.AAC.2